MTVFASLPPALQLGDVFRRFPRAVAPLLAYHDRLLRDRSDLTVAERELIAAYVSGINACTYCYGAHALAAEAFGIAPALFEQLLADLDSSPIDEKLKPILAYVGKLTRTPSKMVPGDAAAVYAAGWSEEALFDAISVCALFNMMNRIVEGSGISIDPLAMTPEDRAARTSRMAAPGTDPHKAAPSYSGLLKIWGIEQG